MTVVLAEELARCRSGGVAFSVIVHTDMSSPWLGRVGTDDQKQRFLPDITSGRKVCALAITEPGVGSDMASLETRAVRDGDDWIINGAKTYITNGVYGDLYFVAAKTRDTGPKHQRLSQFLVDGRNTRPEGQSETEQDGHVGVGHGGTGLRGRPGAPREPARRRGQGILPARLRPPARAVAVCRAERVCGQGKPSTTRLEFLKESRVIRQTAC